MRFKHLIGAMCYMLLFILLLTVGLYAQKLKSDIRVNNKMLNSKQTVQEEAQELLEIVNELKTIRNKMEEVSR